MFEVIIGRKNTKKFYKNNIIEQIPDKITTKQQINNVSMENQEPRYYSF